MALDAGEQYEDRSGRDGSGGENGGLRHGVALRSRATPSPARSPASRMRRIHLGDLDLQRCEVLARAGGVQGMTDPAQLGPAGGADGSMARPATSRASVEGGAMVSVRAGPCAIWVGGGVALPLARYDDLQQGVARPQSGWLPGWPP